jgi:hypothetical protein
MVWSRSHHLTRTGLINFKGNSDVSIQVTRCYICASFFCRCRWEVTHPPCLNWHSQHTHEWMNESTTGLTKMSLKKWRCRWSSSSQRIEVVEFLRPIHQASTTDSSKLQQAGKYTYGWKRTIGAMHMQELLQNDHASCHFNSTVHDNKLIQQPSCTHAWSSNQRTSFLDCVCPLVKCRLTDEPTTIMVVVPHPC